MSSFIPVCIYVIFYGGVISYSNFRAWVRAGAVLSQVDANGYDHRAILIENSDAYIESKDMPQ